MKVGDLVTLNPVAYQAWDREEGPFDSGQLPVGPNALGLILDVLEPATRPLCVEVWWPNGRAQRLYSDELLLVRKPRKRKNSGADPLRNNSNKKSAKAREKRMNTVLDILE